jgi:phosphoglycolate phosphatase
MIGHYGLREFFSPVIGLDNHYASGKVDEGKVLLRELGAALSDIVLIGDTVHDYEVAGELGIDCILIHHGHNSRFRLESCGVPVVPSFSEAMLHIVK